MKEFTVTVRDRNGDSVSEFDVKIECTAQKKNKEPWHRHPIFSAVIAGFVSGMLLMATPFIYDVITDKKEEQTRLSSLHLGLSEEYIISDFGIPIVNIVDELQYSYYKERNSVVLCTYDNKMLVAYMIFQKEEDSLYESIPVTNDYLTKFTYYDFAETPGFSEGNVPANNIDYCYYYERYYGANPANYNYYVVGSYMVFDKATSELAFNFVNVQPLTRVEQLRRIGKPNVFGMIKGGYENEIGMIPMIDNLQTYNDIIFSEWE